MKTSNNPAKYEVLINQTILALNRLDINVKLCQETWDKNIDIAEAHVYDQELGVRLL